jgi:hypothetical protein
MDAIYFDAGILFEPKIALLLSVTFIRPNTIYLLNKRRRAPPHEPRTTFMLEFRGSS